ncbi:unnamed protein product [Porites lobata]|uniref:Uncharacterized protein n=1 Tax=Porites lobata TaxID=104759 RepID=A0ABN8P308_9CNID|nr:unnamed protein product [Porites lobata]
MESFEQKALATADPLLNWWKRYVDDTHTILKKEYSQGFTEHINRIDENIKGTKEHSLAFLGIVTVLHEDGSISH